MGKTACLSKRELHLLHEFHVAWIIPDVGQTRIHFQRGETRVTLLICPFEPFEGFAEVERGLKTFLNCP